MKRLVVIIFMLFAFTNGAYALPACVGSWSTNWTNCQGTYTTADGEKYVGEFKNGKYDGQGTYTFANGNKYVGEWKDSKRNGYFTATYTSGDKYVGEIKGDKRTGQGTYTFADGENYVGEWKNDKYDGQGTFTFANGTIREGIWKDDKFQYAQKKSMPACVGSWSTNWTNCQGTYTFGPNTQWAGDKYVGEHKDGKMHGQGTYTYASGDKYVGEYKDDKMYGQGIYTWAGGAIYVGEWKDDKRNGQGTYTYASGDKYVGEYKDDKMYGQGTYTFAGGTIKEGIWKDDKFQYAQKGPTDNTQTAINIQKPCSDDPTACTVFQLCSNAIIFSDGELNWSTSSDGLKYVEEAKKNGLSCNIKEQKPKVDLNKTYKVASGTGFYVSNTGHLITNDHVVDGCKDIKVQSNGVDIDTVLLATDPKNDLALLKANHTPSIYFSISDKDPEELQDVIVAGYPFGDDISSSIKFTQGIVSSLAGIGNDYSQFQIDAALQPGNSGGPIVDIYGNILGVAVAKLDFQKIMDDYGVVAENTNFGIKASAVRNLMFGNSVKVKSPKSETITTSELVKSIKAGTVHLTCWMTVAQIDALIKEESGKVLFKKFTK
jgi:hypothetical protein